MKYQLKTYDNKILIELTITENGSEFYLSSEVKTLKDKITNANKEHGLQLETDIRNLSLLKYSSNIEENFNEMCENWGLKYEKIY